MWSMIESLNFLRPTIGGERYTYTHAYMRMNKYTQMGMYLCRCICTHFCKQSSTFMPIYTPTHTNDITVLNLLRVRVNTLTHIHIRVAVCVCVCMCVCLCVPCMHVVGASFSIISTSAWHLASDHLQTLSNRVPAIF